jgi:hypothetical protein
MPEVERRPHPPELGEAEAAVARIQDEVRVVVPGDEPGIECGPECRERDARDERGDEREWGAARGVDAAGCARAAQGRPGSRVQITIVPQGRSSCPEVNCAGVVARLA